MMTLVIGLDRLELAMPLHDGDDPVALYLNNYGVSLLLRSGRWTPGPFLKRL
jgi:hypothetical protein